MPEDKNSGPPKGAPPKGAPAKGVKSGGGPRRDGKPPGPGGRRDGDKRGGPRKGGGKGGFGKGPAKPARAETYESLKEIQRGAGFRIDKFMVAEKSSHKPVKIEYRLTREGMDGQQIFARLAEAQTAATAPLPEPTAEPSPEPTVETDIATADPSTDAESADAAAETTEPVATET